MTIPTRDPGSAAPDLSLGGRGDDPKVPRPRTHPAAGPTAEGRPGAPPAPDRAAVVRANPPGSLDVDQRMLVIGYLSTVASMLDRRGFLVRELHAQGPSSPTLWGDLTLNAPPRGSGWAPARVRWDQDSGWCATLMSEGGDEHLAVSRYLPAQLVPAPVTVAHFLAALHTDPDTVWARATFRPPRRVDRRWLILQLARFAMPEPW